MKSTSFITATLMACALSAVAQPFDSLFTPSGAYSAWANGRAIKLNTSATGANVAANVTQVPVLVRLSPAEAHIFAAAKAGGADIRFSKPDLTPLPYQIERWDATSNRAEIWVLADTVLGNSTTQRIYLYWGNTGAADSSRGPAVFDTANKYQGVWHLAQASGNQLDATANAINGGDSNTTASTGAIGRARRFATTDDGTAAGPYIPLGNNATLNARTGNIFTLEAWALNTMEAQTGYQTIFGHSDGITLRVSQNATNPSVTAPRYELAINGAYSTAFSSQADTNKWVHLVAVDSSNLVRIYRNGVRIATATTASAVPSHTSSTGGGNRQWAIGGWYYSSQCADITIPCRSWVGQLDEIRLSNTVRSAEYIKLSYENQRMGQSFTNIGKQETSVPEAPATVSGVGGNALVNVSWTAPYNGGAAITSYKAMAVSDTAKSCTSSGALTCTVTGLTNGTPYTFVVRATNSVGAGPLSLPSAAVSPAAATVPSAPTGVIAVPSSSTQGQAIVGWNASSSDGGSPITLYTATAAPGGASCTNLGDNFCYVNGLTAGTSYTFTVRATNAVGQSAPSAPSSQVDITTSILPGAFRINVNGSGKPYTFELAPGSLANTQRLTMTIRDSRGRTIWSRSVDPSREKVQEITWDGRSNGGATAAAGMYLVHVSVVRNGQEARLMERSVNLKP